MAMSPDAIERAFRESVSSRIELIPDGENRYRVLNPFVLDDGDHLSIVLRHERDGWRLSDEGNTWMRLTYDLSEKDLLDGNRRELISEALSVFRIENRDGEFVLPVSGDDFGEALFSFALGLLKIVSVPLRSP